MGIWPIFLYVIEPYEQPSDVRLLCRFALPFEHGASSFVCGDPCKQFGRFMDPDRGVGGYTLDADAQRERRVLLVYEVLPLWERYWDSDVRSFFA